MIAYALHAVGSVIISRMPELILASGSEQRKILLTAVGWKFRVLPALLDEQTIVSPATVSRPLYLARCKADLVAAKHPESVVIAADTIVCVDGQILEKPTTLVEAFSMLSTLAGQTFQVHTGIALRYRAHIKQQLVITTAQMRALTEQEIERYIRENPVLTWSAGFSPAYPAGMALLAKIDGSFTALTHGLPIEVLSEWLLELGIDAT